MYHSADSTVVDEWGDCHKQSEQANSLHSAFLGVALNHSMTVELTLV